MSPPLPPTPSSTQQLSAPQLFALLDILIHHQAYAEVSSLKLPSTVLSFGPPFSTSPGAGDGPSMPPSCPVLQLFLSRIILPLPGISDLPPEFWHERVRGLVDALAASNLSESYDKGAIGTRRSLATALAACVESLARGLLTGCSPVTAPPAEKDAPLEDSWNRFLHGLVYEDLIDELFDRIAETEDIEGLSDTVQMAAEYTIIQLASFLHHIFVVAPSGPYLRKLIADVHQLLPYMAIRQAFKLGNAAGMINALTKLLLAKLSFTSLSNWAGLTNNPDEGMNLLQRILSAVLAWDRSEFKRTAEKIEKLPAGPIPERLIAIKRFVHEETVETHAKVRSISISESVSIVEAIFVQGDPVLSVESVSLDESEHEEYLKYLAALLAVRDRDEITTVLCRNTPDLLTQAIRDLVTTYDSMIRDLHSRVDLTMHLTAAQAFVDDLIKTSTPAKKAKVKKSTKGSDGVGAGEVNEEELPTVVDFVNLLQRHKGAVHRWWFHVASKCPEIAFRFREYAKKVAEAFRHDPSSAPESPTMTRDAPPSNSPKPLGIFVELENQFAALSPETQTRLIPILDAHNAYITQVHSRSVAAIADIRNGLTYSSSTGPGLYISRWKDLLDATLLTPDTATRRVRTGRDVHGLESGIMSRFSSRRNSPSRRPSPSPEAEVGPGWPPDSEMVIDSLGECFRKSLCDWV